MEAWKVSGWLIRGLSGGYASCFLGHGCMGWACGIRRGGWLRWDGLAWVGGEVVEGRVVMVVGGVLTRLAREVSDAGFRIREPTASCEGATRNELCKVYLLTTDTCSLDHPIKI